MVPARHAVIVTRGAMRVRGFTLLELLVAVAIFAIVAALAFGSLRYMVAGRESLLPQVERLAALQFALGIIDADISAIAPRPTRGALGEMLPCTRGGIDGTLLEFTRYLDDVAWPDAMARLQRVSYELEDGVLYRISWPRPDITQASLPVRRPLLRGLASLRIRFATGSPPQWRETWPDEQSSGQGVDVPGAVEFRFEFEDGGTLRRVLLPYAGGVG